MVFANARGKGVNNLTAPVLSADGVTSEIRGGKPVTRCTMGPARTRPLCAHG